MKKTTLTVVLALAAALPCAATAQEKLTLDESICAAKRQNYQLKSVKEKRSSQEYTAKAAFGDLLPKVKFEAQYIHSEPLAEIAFDSASMFQIKPENIPKDDTNLLQFVMNFKKLFDYNIMSIGASSIKMIDYNQWTANFRVEQPLFSFYPLYQVWRMQKDGAGMAGYLEKSTEQELRSQVVATYLSALKARKMVEIARESVTLITQSVDQAKLFVNAGVAHVSDQLMAEVRLSEAKNGVTRAENGLKLAKSGLNMLMGASITADYELVEVAETIPKLGISLEELLSMAERQRSELKLLDAQSDIARRNIKIAWSGFIPQSGLFFQGGYQSGQDFMPDWSWAAGAVASIPLWEWGKRYYQIKSAQAAYREADGQREYAREGILLQVKQAYLDLSSAEQLIATSEAARKESKENHRVMKMKYEAQMATMLEVLTAALMVSKAEADYFSALYDYGMAMARLARSVEAEAHKISDARPMTMECN